MTDPDISNTIVYLRPRSVEAIRALDDPRNSDLVWKITPHDPMAGLSNSFALHPRVFRLGFNSEQKQASEGFLVGTGSDSDIFIPNHGDIPDPHPGNFRIHYNFESGALLITAVGRLRIGATVLEYEQSLLLMAGTDVECESPALRYMFEFPDLGQYAADHEAKYRAYVGKLGIPNALYMAASRSEEPLLGGVYKSICELGRGGFGIVHKAVNIMTGALYAIKQIPDKLNTKFREYREKERAIIDQLHHVSFLHTLLYN